MGKAIADGRRRTHNVMVRFSTAELGLIRQAAADLALPPSVMVRTAALESARQVVWDGLRGLDPAVIFSPALTRLIR